VSPASDSTPGAVRALYLHVGSEPVFAVLHEPRGARVSAKAVLMCPPFGWEETCSYRRRREWAQVLADAGHPTLRIDLPGTGDSAGSPLDGERLPAWRETISSAAEWLIESVGAERVAAVGIGLGGLMLCEAIADGAPIDEVVLWAVPSRGKAFARELRAFARMEAAKSMPDGEDAGEEHADVGVAVGGFSLSHETMAALEALDATAVTLPPGRPARALLLERDGISVDGALREHFSACGAAVEVKPGDGYGEMIAPPHEGRSPLEVFASTRAWLAQDDPVAGAPSRPASSTRGPAQVAAVSEQLELEVRGVAVSETPIAIEEPFGNLFGVLARPAAGPSVDVTVLLLNAGAHRRIGQGRMWVEAARRLAAAGVPTLRLDLEGIGDADGDGRRFTDMGELYKERLVRQALDALDALDARGLGPRYLAAGLCSGACWSFHMALEDERVRSVLMINPQALFWSSSLDTARMLRRGSKMKVLRGEVELRVLLNFLVRLPVLAFERAMVLVRARRMGSELHRALDRLRDNGKRAAFLFSGCEPLREELEAEGWPQILGHWPNLSFEAIPGEDHILRPLQAQSFVHGALDRAIAEELRRTSGDAGRHDVTQPSRTHSHARLGRALRSSG
jgi:pimeloyl-ACP methyl ester carboxylesterase